MADTVAHRDWRSRKASSSRHLHLPPEIADILNGQQAQIARLMADLVALDTEFRTFRRDVIEHLPDRRVA